MQVAIWLLIAALFGLTGVAMGAASSHGAVADAAAQGGSVDVATLYQLLHALALLAVAWLAGRAPRARLVGLAGWSFTLGVVLFSGSIYLSVLLSVEGITYAAPVGGLLLMAGWALLALHALDLIRRARSHPDDDTVNHGTLDDSGS